MPHHQIERIISQGTELRVGSVWWTKVVSSARKAPAGVPGWVNVLAHLVPLTTLPSGLWRLALGLGIPVGFSGELAEVYGAPGWITPYVIVLSALAEGLALLTLGLVGPWGEIVPSWVPRWGGRPIPTMAVVLPASVGAALITFVNWTSALMWFGPENNGDPDAPHGFAGFVMAACYAPLVVWAPSWASSRPPITYAGGVSRCSRRPSLHDGQTLKSRGL